MVMLEQQPDWMVYAYKTAWASLVPQLALCRRRRRMELLELL